MARSWTDKELKEAFTLIWPRWINKDNPNAALKALGILLRQGEHFDIIKLACDIYTEDHFGEDPSYTTQLKNFLHEDQWKDILEGAHNPKSYLEWQQARRAEGEAVVQAWNLTCKSHWCQVEDVAYRIPLAKKALQNDSFKNNWQKALDKLGKIFQYKPREGSQYAKLILTFKWFCNVSADKHTVLDILEGKYGNAPVEKAPPKKVKYKELTHQDREEIASDFEEIFGRPLKRNESRHSSSSSESREESDDNGKLSL